jgi:isocitrate lyase
MVQAHGNGEARPETLALRQIQQEWGSDRWTGIKRDYSPEDVYSLRGSVKVEFSIAKMSSERLWSSMHSRPYIQALGAVTGNQAVQMVQAGLEAIYLSGWQVAADANLAGQTYPDLSLYPANSVPSLVKRLNQALLRADQIDHLGGGAKTHWLCPILADGEAGFGGPLNVYELMKAMIEAGAAGVHFEDQVASDKKCGHMGGKVLVPTSHFIRTLTAARLGADVSGVPTIIVARTDARDSNFIASDVDPRDKPFLTGERAPEGYYVVRNGMDLAIQRGLSYAAYADLLWFETQKPDLEEARRFANEIHRSYPGKLLAYNLSPSFNWDKAMTQEELDRFQRELGQLGYKFQFVTLAGFHALNESTFELAKGFERRGMSAYVDLQRKEFAIEKEGYTATRHQAFVGAGYFDEVLRIVSGGSSSTTAMENSTEAEQFAPSEDRPKEEQPAKAVPGRAEPDRARRSRRAT